MLQFSDTFLFNTSFTIIVVPGMPLTGRMADFIFYI